MFWHAHCSHELLVSLAWPVLALPCAPLSHLVLHGCDGQGSGSLLVHNGTKASLALHRQMNKQHTEFRSYSDQHLLEQSSALAIACYRLLPQKFIDCFDELQIRMNQGLLLLLLQASDAAA